MAKVENVKPAMTVSTFFQIADFLVVNGEGKMKEIGTTMKSMYDLGLVEKEKRNATYEESDSTGTPENYQNTKECKTGDCD